MFAGFTDLCVSAVFCVALLRVKVAIGNGRGGVCTASAVLLLRTTV